MKTITSGFMSLDWKDAAKGLLMAVIVPAIAIIEQSVQAGSLTLNWKTIGGAALAGGLGYLMKNFFTPAKEVAPANPLAK